MPGQRDSARSPAVLCLLARDAPVAPPPKNRPPGKGRRRYANGGTEPVRTMVRSVGPVGPVVPSFKTSGQVSQDIGQPRARAELGVACGVSDDIEDGRARAGRDVESPTCHHCCHCREGPAARSPAPTGSPRLGLRAGGPVPGRGRGGIRAPVAGGPKTSPAAISDDTVDLIVGLRKELAGQGLDAGPDTICWHLRHHHQVRVSPATISRYLARAGLVTPEPKKRPKSSYIRFAGRAAQRVLAVRLHPLPARRRHRTPRSSPGWMTTPGYALSVTAHHRVTGPIVLAAFRAAVAATASRPRR